jgi:hypothetical protein
VEPSVGASVAPDSSPLLQPVIMAPMEQTIAITNSKDSNFFILFILSSYNV